MKTKINQKGVIHHVLPLIIAVVVGISGIYLLVTSNAESITQSQTCNSSFTPGTNTQIYPQISQSFINYRKYTNIYQIPNFQPYGNNIRKPAGFQANSHLVLSKRYGLVIQGYPDPHNPALLQNYKHITGVVAGGFDVGYPFVSSGGGFDVCLQMSKGNWQHVELLVIGWPSDGNFSEGEVDAFEGSPQNLSMHVHEIAPQYPGPGICNCKTCKDPRCNAYNGTWPKLLATPGPHLLSFRWNPQQYLFYVDHKLAIRVPVNAAKGGLVSAVTTDHELSIGMRDVYENSNSREDTYIYWSAAYGYNPSAQ